jgi:hypothetical protein
VDRSRTLVLARMQQLLGPALVQSIIVQRTRG